MTSRRPDRWDDEEDRGRYRRAERDDDRGRGDRRPRDDEEDEGPRRRRSRRDEDDDYEDRPRRPRRKRPPESKKGLVVLLILVIGLPLLGLGGFLIYYFASGSKDAERLVGHWEGPGGISLDFNKDMSLMLTGKKGDTARTKWVVRSSTGDTMIIHLHNPSSINGVQLKSKEAWTITFVSENEIQIKEGSGVLGRSTFNRKPPSGR